MFLTIPPTDKCPICQTKLTFILVNDREIYDHAPYNECRYYSVVKSDNELRNQFTINNYWVYNNYLLNGKTVINFNIGYKISIDLIDWDYSSVKTMQEQLNLILSFI